MPENVVSLEDKEVISHLLELVDEISQDSEYNEAFEFIISCVRKSEREIKEIVKTGSEDSIETERESASDVNIEQARKSFMVRNGQLIKGNFKKYCWELVRRLSESIESAHR